MPSHHSAPAIDPALLFLPYGSGPEPEPDLVASDPDSAGLKHGPAPKNGPAPKVRTWLLKFEPGY